MPEHDPEHELGNEDVESQVPSPSVDSTPALHQGVHIHRLGHNQIFARPRWDTVEHILWDVALIVGVPFEQLSHCHHVQVAPNDVAEHEDSVIIQHIHDVPAGSTEQLVLVDVEMHSQQSNSVMPRAPAVSRQVHRVVPTLVRRHLLLLTRTAAYCDWHPQDCIVFCNREVWNENDHGPRRITHGMYFRIILPPPPSSTWEISRAVNVFHEAFDLFDQELAGRVAERVLNENQEWPPAADADVGRTHRECKGADLEGHIDVPIMLAPHVRVRRPRPVHDGTEQWLWDLGHVFSSQALAEAFEDEIYLYVQTWYIDHERHTVCRTPRPIRLARHSIEWIDEFRHVWRDLMNPRVFFSIYVVKPRPPQPGHHGYACHILLEQNRHRGNAAGILTAILESHNRDAIIQGAFSTPRFLRRQDVVDLLEVERFCTGRRCTAYFHDEPVHLILATEVDSGFSIRLHISPPADQLPRAPQAPSYFDEIVFMQVPADADATNVNRCATDLPGRTAECTNFDPPFIFNPHAEVFVPGNSLPSDATEFLQELHDQWTRAATAWAEELPSATFITWFVDHRQPYPTCVASRRVALYLPPDSWEYSIKRAWSDVIERTASHEMHLVTPMPPDLETGIGGHIIVIQSPNPAWVTSLVTVFDSFISAREQNMMRLAITTDEHIRIEQIVQHCGYELIAGRLNPQIPCRVWIDQHQLTEGRRWPGRSGHEITLRVDRQVVPLPAHFADEEAFFALQIASRIRVETEPTRIYLQDEIPVDSLVPQLVPVALRHIDSDRSLPCELIVSDGFESHDIETELAAIGYFRHVYVLRNCGIALTVPFNWKASPVHFHYVYCPTNANDGTEILLHTNDKGMNDHDHMVHLHKLGFLRAVILDHWHVRESLTIVYFHNNVPQLEKVRRGSMLHTPWPEPQPTQSVGHMWDKTKLPSYVPAQKLRLGINVQVLDDFFQSSQHVLCPWFSHLDLPDFVMQGICDATPQEGIMPDLASFDRLIIYTDGSSRPSERRKPPLRVDLEGTPDAWAYIVLGEKYPSEHGPGSLHFIGWHAQSVRHDPTCAGYVGTEHIGAEHAEREALIHAGIWRLAANVTTPTVFRTDSTTTATQATGDAGAQNPHGTFAILRGIFQALQAGLGPRALEVAHVRGHAGDVWNELADFLAKTEATCSHNLIRHDVDFRVFGPIIPYLWMIFDEHCGLPTFTETGFDVQPPDLPPAVSCQTQSADIGIGKVCRFNCSFATFNVGSLFVKPDGYGGKLQYLRQQMQEHALNFLGIQEARSPPGLSMADDILRIAGGDDKGHFGVELWIAMKQPIAFHAKPFMFRDHTSKCSIMTLDGSLSELLVLFLTVSCLFFMHHKAVDPIRKEPNGGRIPLALQMICAVNFQFLC